MPSFRTPRAQAKMALGPYIRVGNSRHKAKLEGEAERFVYSFGTRRNYEQALKQCAEWYISQARLRRPGFEAQVRDITREQAKEYLEHRAGQVGQKQLDLDRQAIEKILGQRLGRIKSAAEKPIRLATRPRAYTLLQAEYIAQHQSATNAIATLIAAHAGLRAHELLTLGTEVEQPRSTHRPARSDLFIGLEHHHIHTVVGKGGLVRPVAIPIELHNRLSELRLREERGVRDRGIWYRQRYDIGGGQSWCQSFGEASKRALGWSAGAHGLRHGYAQRRLETLQTLGLTWGDALEVVSMTLGHFCPSVTMSYLR